MVQAVQVPVVCIRPETPERWERALQRALANGLEVFVAADTGERMVTSASQLDTLHRTDGTECTCKAGLSGDPVCCHRAVVRFVSGWLGDGPETPAPALAPVACLRCNGCGRVPNDYRERYDPCPVCGGTGGVPAPVTRPYGLPAVQPVAAVAA